MKYFRKTPPEVQINICTTTTIKTSLEETMAFVNYHLKIGINRLYLFFDDPNDGAIEYLADNTKVICIKCDENHWLNFCAEKNPTFLKKQKINATYALQLARKDHFEWIAHIDSDELIYSKKSIIKILGEANPKTNIVYMRVFESLPQHLNHSNLFKEITHFKESLCPGAIRHSVNLQSKFKLVSLRYTYKCKMLLSSFLSGKFIHGFIIGHEQGKCFLRTCADVHAFDVHYPLFKEPIRSQCYNEIMLLHYEAPSISKFKNKWIIRLNGQQNYLLGSKKEIYLANLFKQVYKDDHAILELFKSLYLISENKTRLLQKLGLIREIKLNLSTFDNNDHGRKKNTSSYTSKK